MRPTRLRHWFAAQLFRAGTRLCECAALLYGVRDLRGGRQWPAPIPEDKP